MQTRAAPRARFWEMRLFLILQASSRGGQESECQVPTPVGRAPTTGQQFLQIKVSGGYQNCTDPAPNHILNKRGPEQQDTATLPGAPDTGTSQGASASMELECCDCLAWGPGSGRKQG